MSFQRTCKIHGFKPTGILHVGAAMLEEAEMYRDLGVNTVIWVEAQPHNERRSRRALEFGHVLHENTPLSNRRAKMTLKLASNEVSSSILPFKRHSAIYPDIYVKEEIEVETLRADELFNEGLPPEVNTLVLDVQGAELLVLEGMGKLLDQIKLVWAEVNLKELYEGCALKDGLEKWLKDHGFIWQEFFPVHADEWGDGCYRKP